MRKAEASPHPLPNLPAGRQGGGAGREVQAKKPIRSSAPRCGSSTPLWGAGGLC